MLRSRKNPNTPEDTAEKAKALRAQEMDAAGVKTHRDVKAKYTLEDIKRLRTEEGLSVDEIAERYGKSPGTISVFLKRKGYSIQDFPRGSSRRKETGRPRKDYGITLEDVRRERAQGKSNSQIAKALNISTQQLGYFLQKQGVKLSDMDSGGVTIHQGRKAGYTLEDIKRLRTEEGLTVHEIGERYGVAGGVISDYLKKRELSIKDIPRGGSMSKGAARPRKGYGITLEDVRRERAEGKSHSQIARALHISAAQLTAFLVQQGVKLSDMDSGGHEISKGRATSYTVDDIRRLRTEEGLTVHEIGERYGVAGSSIFDFLKRRGHSIKDFPKGNKQPRLKSAVRSPRDLGITIEDVIRERAKGKSNSQIAKALNISTQQLGYFLQKQGVKLRDMDTGGVEIRRAPEAGYTLEDIIRLRSGRGLTIHEIASELGSHASVISTYLKDRGLSIRDIPRGSGGFQDRGAADPRVDYGITIEEVRRERAQGKSNSQIAQALDISVPDLQNFLKQQGATLSEMDSGGHEISKGRAASYTVDDIRRLRTEEGLTVHEIGERFNVAGANISEFLKRRGHSIKDFPRGGSRSNPMTQSGMVSKVTSASVGAGASVAISKVLDTRYPEMGLVKRSLISGGVPAGVSLGVYAKTKNEAALWGLAGSVVGTALSAYLFKK